jgi:hypothetical protein
MPEREQFWATSSGKQKVLALVPVHAWLSLSLLALVDAWVPPAASFAVHVLHLGRGSPSVHVAVSETERCIKLG